MAKKNNRSPFAFTPIVLDQDSHEKRRIVKQLPAVHQTETLQKFFGATADHLFDPGKGRAINGYVGQKPLWYDPDQDYYLEENTSERTFYQLEASMVSKDTEGELSDLLPYPDLINQLRFQGALTNNHNRLFSQDYYTWCPPIDLDKIVNFRQYVWLPVAGLSPTSTFEDDQSDGWILEDGTPATIRGPWTGLSKYIGDFGGNPTGAQVVSKTFTLNSSATSAQIEFDFIKLNSWDSVPNMYQAPQAYGPESIFVHLNDEFAFSFTPVDIGGNGGASLGSGSFVVDGLTGTYNVTSPGADANLDTNNPDSQQFTDRVYRVTMTVLGTGATLKLGFGSNTDEPWQNESFGLDNIRLSQVSTAAVIVNGPTQTYKSQGNTSVYNLPGYGTGADAELQGLYDIDILTSGLIHAEVDGVSRPFTYVTGEDKITFAQRPAFDAEISISVYSDLENNAIGLPSTNVKAFGGTQLSSGMRIIVRLDKNSDFKNNQIYIVEGVGRSIFLIKEEDNGASDTPDYMVMERGSSDRNEWSTGNRWFHVDTLPESLDPDYVLRQRANRPIIEFNRGLELYNYGSTRRFDVDIVVENIEDLNGYMNQNPTSITLDGVTVVTRGTNMISMTAVDPTTGVTYGDRTSIRIMVRNTVNELLNNNILVLVNQGGILKLILETDGDNPSGQPIYGEVFKVKLGSYASKNLHWDGASWIVGQNKTKVNQAPLFELYDLNGNSLRDDGIYPNSTFKGSKLFNYKVDTTGTRVADAALGIALVHDNKGQIQFENFLHTEAYQYVVGGRFLDITGFYFHRSGEQFSNDWYKGPSRTRQFMIDRYVSDGRTKLFAFSQNAEELYVSLGRVNESKSFERTDLVEDTDYIRMGRQIMILNIKLGDVIEIRSFSSANPPVDATGHYEIPLNLQANPDNDEVTTLTKGDFYDHFSEIMKKQAGFDGAEYALNNYRDTAKAMNLGTHIIQHSAGLLKTMLLASSQNLDLPASIRFADSEYSRFKAKFQQKIVSYVNQNRLTNATSYDTWINTALEEINKGKTKLFPFYLSGMAKNESNLLPTFIPPTPSFLGVHPLYAPEIVSDEVSDEDGNTVTVWYVRGHDGSLTLGENEISARVLMALEERIFNSIPASIRMRERPVCDPLLAYGDQFRSVDYTYDEYLQILRPSFERWAIANRLDVRTNEYYDSDDLWTWNWSQILTSDGQKVPGHWRGIYEKFFGTQRPDIMPWESLGFSIKPDWWDDRYGSAPYTSENLVLWNDLENGYIHSGPRQGFNAHLARPGLSQHIPVDLRGRLRHPGPRWRPSDTGPNLDQSWTESQYVEWEDTSADDVVLGCGILPTLPLVSDRKADWNYGDMGPTEQNWRRSSTFMFAAATASYLMKPAAFVELGWNTQDIELFFAGSVNEQWMNQDTMGRPSNSELQVHGEVLDDLSLVTKVGIQQWVSDYLANRNSEINSNLAEKVRGLGSQLSYKVGGFSDATTLITVSDAFGRIPSEDVTISSYRSPSIREETYSGLAIEYKSNGYEIYGYDALNPYFYTIPADKNGSKISVGSGIKASNPTPLWRGATYYTVNIVVKHEDNFYRALKTHTSSTFFEPSYWTQVSRPQYADGGALVWYLGQPVSPVIEKVAYGTILKTPQQVADFVNGYNRYLESRGWKFDSLNDDQDDIRDWRSALTSFITWSSQTDREEGDFLSLSPSSKLIQYSTDHGTIQPVEQIINGLYAIVNQNGQPIDPKDTRVVRNDGSISIYCDSTTSGVFGLRLYVSEIEHVLVFNNKTIFGDTIYSPLLNIKQPRIRLQGFKTVGWKGRVDAPGFIVTGDTLTPNFERAADDFRRFFEIESMENKSLQDRARANFGYEEREYLNNLLLTSTNQFEFYQGMIQQKGSPTSMRRLLRSNFIRHNKGLKLFEEWAFRVGDYGGQEVTPQLDIQIRQSEFKNNPQLIKFTNASEANTYGVINVVDTKNADGSLNDLDDRWNWRPDIADINWPTKDFVANATTPETAGPVNLDEVRFTVATNEEFEDFYGSLLDQDEVINDRDRVWVYGIGSGSASTSWMTYKFNSTGFNIVDVAAPTFEGQGSIVQLDKNLNGFDGYNDPWTKPFYLSQPLLANEYDDNGFRISGERLVLKNIENTDLNPRMTYVPATRNKAKATLETTDQAVLMAFMPQAGQMLKSITVIVDEAFPSDATLEIGHSEIHDFFLPADMINLSVTGTYEISSLNNPNFPWNTSLAGGATYMTADLVSASTYGSLRIEVAYYYTKGVELLENLNGSLIPSFVNSEGGTGEFYTWLKTRYPTWDAIPKDARLWDNGDIVEVDVINPGQEIPLWGVFKYQNGWSQEPIRVENRKINSDLLTNAAIFNSTENKLKLVLQLYDPLKGFIPGTADRELEYKTKADPAIYNDGLMVWGKEQVGKLWWNLSTTRYLDYEIYDDLSNGVNYRWKNWGRIAPNTSIDIYEWTCSPVTPNSWSAYVESKANLKIDNKPSGEVEETAPYIIDVEWNDEIQAEETVYYFWVKNPTVVPGIPSRKLSARQVSNIISNPSAQDIPYFAVIDTNKVVVGGIRQFLNETDTVLKIKWNLDADIHNNHHKQWMILREEDERNTINDVLWNKMRDSVVGWDATQAYVPDTKLPKAQQVGALVRPRQSWFPTDATATGQRPSRGAREAFVDVMNDILSAAPFTETMPNWENVFASGEALPTEDRYITTALDLTDLANLLPASRNMVQPGECVLIENTVDAAGFWTLWKLVEISGQRTFILEDFQKWRMQEGELWNLADWYAEDWSAKNFPNYRFATEDDRKAAGNLDVTLLKGTLVQVDHSDTANPQWTWDVYTSTTKYQVAKAKSTMKLSDAFYDASRVEFGPREVSAILNASEATRITPARIQELADLINYRDGSREIEYILNTIKSDVFDVLQKNKLFFGMVKSAFKQSQVIDWAFKTSFLYLGGYSETLRQSPVAFKDQIDNVIAYLEEVKPYHVKIREYVRRLSYGPDVADLAMTDFDKPVYPDSGSYRVLNPNNAADQNILGLNRPWKDWYENFQKPVQELADWNLEWNGVRKMKVKMKFDRIACGTVSGWDTFPWDPALLVYSQIGGETQSLSTLNAMYRNKNTGGDPEFYRDQTVETIEDRNYLVRKGIVTEDRSGTIVTVLTTGEHFMWTGEAWAKFEAIGWDQGPDMGAVTRVEESYYPLPGMTRADDAGLIAGCDFDGTVISSSFVQDEWDIFEWDSTGYSQGMREHIGVDVDKIDGNTTASDENDPANIKISGNQFAQPHRDSGRPHELVSIRGIESIVINVTQNGAPLRKSFMNAQNKWQDTVIGNSGISFVDWDQINKQVTLTVPDWNEDGNGFTAIHDPQNPSNGFIRDIMLSKGYRSTSNVDMTSAGVKTFKLRDMADIDSLPAGLMGDNVKVAIVNTRDPSKRAIGVLSNSKGNEVGSWNGSITVDFTDGFVDIGSGKSWNIIPVDMFNEPGIVWIDNARFTYTEIERTGNTAILKNAGLSASSLECLNIAEDNSVTLKSTGPVFDGSKHRQNA